MRTIRNTVFETNSSSCHAITFDDTPVDIQKQPVRLNIDGTGDFGWSGDDVIDPEEKLNYALIAFIDYCTGQKVDEDQLYDTENEIKERVRRALTDVQQYFNTKNVEIEWDEPLFKLKHYKWDDKIAIYPEMHGYIDHQSGPHENNDCKMLAEWFENDNEKLFNFCFNNSYIVLDNDNG